MSRSYGKSLKKRTSRLQVPDPSGSPGHTGILRTPLSFIPRIIQGQLMSCNFFGLDKAAGGATMLALFHSNFFIEGNFFSSPRRLKIFCGCFPLK